MNSNTHAKSCVDSVLGYENIKPLYFYNYDYKSSIGQTFTKKEFHDITIGEKINLKQAIINTLEHTQNYYSSIDNAKNSMETFPDCYRSALDIWRHLLVNNPKLTLHEVMRCIADNWQEMKLYSHYCCTVERRVFRNTQNRDSWDVEINDDDERDEFGLTFDEWSLL